MGNQTQQKIFRAMAEPEFYPHQVSRIRQKDTHISKVFLTGPYAYKIKKPVDLDFLDFSTLEKRRRCCEREVLLNRRLTEDVYLDVVGITRDKGVYAMGGDTKAVEYAVRMRQLADSRMLENLISGDKAIPQDMAALGRTLARFYLSSPRQDSLGADHVWQNLFNACEENFSQTSGCSRTLFDRDLWETVRDATLSFLKNRRTCFDQRFREGWIRDCHGDLRCGHVYFTDKGIQIIDCIEFNDRLRRIDIASDLAFLLMDLDFRARPQYGDILLDEYLKLTADTRAFQLLPFYKCYRAVVRCKVNCILLSSQGLDRRQRKEAHLDALGYLDLARQYVLQFSRPGVWVVCGVPASGKSTVAERLSRALGIKVFRSDEIRKGIFGLSPLDSGIARMGKKLYSAQATALTYEKMLSLARQKIDAGCSTVLDATFSLEKHRRDLMRLTQDKAIRPIFIECTADDRILKQRLASRESTPSVSDARIHDFETLKARYEPFKADGRCLHIRIDTATQVDESIRQLLIQSFRISPCSMNSPSRILGEQKID
ncbi:MAG: AAA family ATPase [Pseudomonadota bacterium]